MGYGKFLCRCAEDWLGMRFGVVFMTNSFWVLMLPTTALGISLQTGSHDYTIVYFLRLWQLPQTKGAKFLYDSFLKDFLKKNESKIDAALAEAKTTAGAVAADVAKATGEAIEAVTQETKKES